MIDWAWAVDHLDELSGRTLQHFVLAGIAVGVGFVISLGLAIWAARRPSSGRRSCRSRGSSTRSRASPCSRRSCR